MYSVHIKNDVKDGDGRNQHAEIVTAELNGQAMSAVLLIGIIFVVVQNRVVTYKNS